jgi:regulator of protease activity HflC (stomatin/prohibitin superfamily)
VTEQQAPPPPAEAAAAPVPQPMDADGQVIASPYIQIVEVNATPLDAAEALERPDAYGRVPLVVRIQRQPPIRFELILIAIGLAASGLFLPLVAALRAVIIAGALVFLIVGIISRLFLRVPPGSVGLVVKAGRVAEAFGPGIHFVRPNVALTHLVTTRELAFDVPVSEVRSADGIAVTVDLLLTLGITDPLKLAYTITSSDLDQLVHASTQEAVRTLIRGTQALDALDLDTVAATHLRETIDAKLTPYGIEVRAVAFTRVALPAQLMASVEARRLAAVQLIEEEQNFALEQRRISDRASLLSQEAEARRSAIEHEAAGEAVRLQRLEERLVASPRAATYDLETSRLRVAQQLAGNSRAVVSVGGGQLLADLLVAREAASVPSGEEPVAVAAQAPSPAPGPAPEAEAPAPAAERRVGARARARRGA